MKLLNVVSAKALWFVDPREINPRGKSLFPGLIDWLKEEYEFIKVPSSALDASPEGGLVFTGGSFETQGDLIAVDVTLFNDGFVANTQSSTRDSDLFLGQMLTLASESFKLAFEPGLIRKKAYVSELNITTDHAIADLNPKLADFSAKLTSLLAAQEPTIRFDAAVLAFWPDPALQTLRPAGFTFERKHGIPFVERKYYSQAPFDTETHLRLLNELEALLNP